jgi:hypothetical protein
MPTACMAMAIANSSQPLGEQARRLPLQLHRHYVVTIDNRSPNRQDNNVRATSGLVETTKSHWGPDNAHLSAGVFATQ